MRRLEKDAGGEILGRGAEILSRPFFGRERSLGFNRNIQKRVTNGLNEPIRRVLERARVNKAVGKAVEIGMTPIPGTPKLVLPIMGKSQRKVLGDRIGNSFVKNVSENPETVLVPRPDHAKIYLGAKKAFGKIIRARPLGTTPPPIASAVKTAGQITEAIKDPTVRKILALAAGAYVFKHLVDGAVENQQQRSRQELDGDRPFSYGERRFEKLAKVSPYQQETQHTCSAACLKTVLDHYGLSLDEHSVSKVIGVRQRGGAETFQIASAARELGFLCFEYSFDSIQQARVLTDQDIPIIADIQSFNHPGSGHYVVIHAINDEAVHLMDPNTPGNTRSISHQEMEERWWDRAMRPPHDLMKRWGVIVLPAE